MSSCSNGHSEQETTESPTPSQKELPGGMNSSERILKVSFKLKLFLYDSINVIIVGNVL